MKRIITIVVLTILMMSPALAQENKRPRFSPEEFKAKMEAYITQKAELTPSESEAVFPIFHEMKQKQRQLMQKEHKLKHNCASMKSDKDYQNALSEIMDIRTESAKIGAEYYKKMSKVISPRKAYGVMLADDSFHREMLQCFNNKPKDKNGIKSKH